MQYPWLYTLTNTQGQSKAKSLVQIWLPVTLFDIQFLSLRIQYPNSSAFFLWATTRKITQRKWEWILTLLPYNQALLLSTQLHPGLISDFVTTEYILKPKGGIFFAKNTSSKVLGEVPFALKKSNGSSGGTISHFSCPENEIRGLMFCNCL